MAKNLLLITPYTDEFYPLVIDSLRRVLPTEAIENIEIEFKYAQFKYFSPLYNENYFKELTPSVRQKIEYLYNQQYQMFFDSVGKLSKQGILILNPLGRETYSLMAGFNQPVHHKFYHIRDLLIKMCAFNKQNHYTFKAIKGQPPYNIYHELSINNNNHLLELEEENQLRLDIYVKEQAPEQLRGRYSFSTKVGWKKVNKNPLCPQVDYILSERTFRFAVNKQIEISVQGSMLKKIAEILRKPKVTDIRLKRLLRVNKGRICEYALSEIYNIKDIDSVRQLPDKMQQSTEQLKKYIHKIFINFYCESQKNSIKWEIESEFRKEHTELMKKMVMSGRLHDLKKELESAVQELYALFYADHTTKVKEMAWLNNRVSSMQQTRLENEFGNYMREELYQQMKNKF